MHISCSYDESAKRITGLLFDGQVDHSIFYLVQNDNLGIETSDSFRAYVSTDKAVTRESKNVAFRELRVWSVVRDSDQILEGRYTSLNAENEIEEGLVSYFRLAEGGF